MGASSQQERSDLHPTAVLIGKVGAGKTTIFNKVCDAQRQAEITDDSCTRQLVGKKAFYDGDSLTLYDGPGCDSTADTYSQIFVLRHGLTNEPLNCVFVVVPYNPRIRNMGSVDFFEVAKILKPEYYDLIALVVTKMDQFVQDAKFRTRSAIEQHIRDSFSKEYGIERVVFSSFDMPGPELFHALRAEAVKTPRQQLTYTDEEFVEYFDMKAWKGRERFDLHRFKKQVEKLCAQFSEGLAHLAQNRAAFSHDEFQDFIYAMIQQNRMELDNDVYEPFLQRNGDDAVAFDDYMAWIELHKLVRKAHEQFRMEAKNYLAVNPDNHANWRNAVRYCQFCRQVWVKVEGCDGETTCGARPRSGDGRGKQPYFRLMWQRVDGRLRPGKLLMNAEEPNFATSSSSRTTMLRRRDRIIGCGQSIIWRDQAVVPQAKLDELFNAQELETILGSFKMGSKFRKLRKRRERSIQVFGQLDENGKDVVTQSAEPNASADAGSNGESAGDLDAEGM